MKQSKIKKLVHISQIIDKKSILKSASLIKKVKLAKYGRKSTSETINTYCYYDLSTDMNHLKYRFDPVSIAAITTSSIIYYFTM